MNIEKYVNEFLQYKASCEIYRHHIDNSDINQKDKEILESMFNIDYQNLQIVKNYIDVFMEVTIEALEKSELQIKKIKQNTKASDERKKKYIRELTTNINFLKSELNKVYNKI